jgi:hypothetical protein
MKISSSKLVILLVIATSSLLVLPNMITNEFKTYGTTDCDSSYPDICIPSSPDVNCGDISDKRFTVLPPDPHGLDRDGDVIGCES